MLPKIGAALPILNTQFATLPATSCTQGVPVKTMSSRSEVLSSKDDRSDIKLASLLSLGLDEELDNFARCLRLL